MTGKIVLLIEDDKKVQGYNKFLLMEEGFTVETAMTLADARAFMQNRLPDIIVLDRGMPDGEGLDLLREIRSRGNRIPVLLLTGYGEDKEVELGFDMGCDDYLAKPYTFGVLHKRLTRLLKNAEQVPEVITRGLLTLKSIQQEAFVNGVNLMLTPIDFKLLQFFTQNESSLMNADYIYEKVWGKPMLGDSQALSSAVLRVRKKIKGCGYTITTEYGNGYCFERGDA